MTSRLGNSKLILILIVFRIPYLDLLQTPAYEASYFWICLAGLLLSMVHYIVNGFFVAVCLYVVACLQDLRITFSQLRDKWVVLENRVESRRFHFRKDEAFLKGLTGAVTSHIEILRIWEMLGKTMSEIIFFLFSFGAIVICMCLFGAVIVSSFLQLSGLTFANTCVQRAWIFFAF